jgi:hypothetical protein
MAATYEPIATASASGSVSEVTFSTIPGTYTDLIVISNLGSTSNLNLRVQVNGVTGAYYSATQVIGNGTSASSDRSTGETYWYLGYNAANERFMNILQIMNYANTTTYKTAIWRRNDGGTGNNIGASVGLWRGSTGSATEAITSIKFYDASSVNFTSGSTFTLYGIKAA